MTAAEQACLLSHHRAWKRFMETGQDYCTVLEDDVHLGAGFVQFLQEAPPVRSRFDVIKLDTWGTVVRISRRNYRTPATSLRVARLYSRHLGAAAYVISRSAVRKLLPFVGQCEVPVDWLLFGKRSVRFSKPALRAYQVLPALATQDQFLASSPGFVDLPSTIEGARDAARRERPKPARKPVTPFVRMCSHAACFLAGQQRTVVSFEPDIRGGSPGRPGVNTSV
jgi:glycosyl transferase family 25